MCATDHKHSQSILILPIFAKWVELYLYRFLSSADPFSYTADVPPGWELPPTELAPDSSDSGGEMEYYELGSTKAGHSAPRLKEAELKEPTLQPPKRPIDRSRWSKVRKGMKRQGSGGYGRLAA